MRKHIKPQQHSSRIKIKHKTLKLKILTALLTPTMDLGLREAITSQTSFSLGLSTDLISLPSFSDSNLAFSPLFLHLLLSLLAAGSTGPTLQQLLSFLSSNGTSELSALYSHMSDVLLIDGSAAGGPCLCYACGVWVDEGDRTTLKKSFREIAVSVYKAEIYPVPFRSMVRCILCYGY
jgi:serpin B